MPGNKPPRACSPCQPHLAWSGGLPHGFILKHVNSRQMNQISLTSKLIANEVITCSAIRVMEEPGLGSAERRLERPEDFILFFSKQKGREPPELKGSKWLFTGPCSVAGGASRALRGQHRAGVRQGKCGLVGRAGDSGLLRSVPGSATNSWGPEENLGWQAGEPCTCPFLRLEGRGLKLHWGQ